MKSLITKLIPRLLIPLVAVFGYLGIAQAAPNATLGLSANKTNLSTGQDVVVTVKLDVNEFGAGSIRTTVKYDASLLDYVSLSENDSAFDTALGGITATSGSILRSRGNTTSGVTGSGKKVFDINFKAKANGTATISFDSNSHIWEAGTGTEQSLAKDATLAITIAPAQAASTPTPAQATATPTPTPKAATPKPTAKPTAKPVVTAKPATSNPTATSAATATPAATNGSAVSPTQSSVTLSQTSAKADGIDKININVIVRTNDGTVVTDVTPTLAGLRASGDTATEFTYDSTTQSWSSDVTSTVAGPLTLAITAKDVQLASQDVTFTATESPAAAASTNSGSSSFTMFLIIGLLVLLLLLILLFFLYKRLKKHDDDDFEGDVSGPAYPGEGDNGGQTSNTPAEMPAEAKPEVIPAPVADKREGMPLAPAAPIPTEEAATFNPDQALQRSQPPSADAPPAEATDEDSIPL